MPRFPWKAVAVGGLLVGGLTAVISRRSAKRTRPVGRVALIGDSYAVGLGPELAKILPDFKYEGRVGISTGGWLNCTSCAPWLTSFKPDLVLVSLGVNDGASPNSANYQAIVRALHGIGARVAWIEPPAGVHNDAVRKTIESLGVPTVAATNSPLSADGLHPKAYGPWAGEIAHEIG